MLVFALFVPFTVALSSAMAFTCVAHKGVTDSASENSLAAFEAAVARGASAIEMDIRHTRDHVPIILHDSTLKKVAESRPNRVCPLETPVSKLRYNEISDNCQLLDGQSVPTLDSVLRVFFDHPVTLLLEFKSFVRLKTLKLVERYYFDHPERVRIMSINPVENLLEILPLAASSSFFRRVRVYSMPKKFFTLAAWGYGGVDTHEITAKQVRYMHRHKKEVSVWTFNTDEEIRHYASIGVDFLTTDELDLCLEIERLISYNHTRSSELLETLPFVSTASM